MLSIDLQRSKIAWDVAFLIKNAFFWRKDIFYYYYIKTNWNALYFLKSYLEFHFKRMIQPLKKE